MRITNWNEKKCNKIQLWMDWDTYILKWSENKRRKPRLKVTFCLTVLQQLSLWISMLNLNKERIQNNGNKDKNKKIWWMDTSTYRCSIPLGSRTCCFGTSPGWGRRGLSHCTLVVQNTWPSVLDTPKLSH